MHPTAVGTQHHAFAQAGAEKVAHVLLDLPKILGAAYPATCNAKRKSKTKQWRVRKLVIHMIFPFKPVGARTEADWGVGTARMAAFKACPSGCVGCQLLNA